MESGEISALTKPSRRLTSVRNVVNVGETSTGFWTSIASLKVDSHRGIWKMARDLPVDLMEWDHF